MPITASLKDFAIIGIKNLLFYDANDNMVANLDKLKNINIGDTTESADITGGLFNKKLLKLYGNRETTLTASAASLSTDIINVLTGNIPTIKSVNVPKIEKKVAVTTNSATLVGTPLTTATITVYTSDSKGQDLTRLTKVASAPTAGQFSITGSVITFGDTIAFANAYYFVAQESEVITFTNDNRPTYKAYGKCLLQNLTTKLLYSGNIEMPSIMADPSMTIVGSNELNTDAVDLTFELLIPDGGTYPYAIIANQVNSASEL